MKNQKPQSKLFKKFGVLASNNSLFSMFSVQPKTNAFPTYQSGSCGSSYKQLIPFFSVVVFTKNKA